MVKGAGYIIFSHYFMAFNALSTPIKPKNDNVINPPVTRNE